MAEYTDFHDLGKFERGDNQWSHSDTVDLVERNVAKEDTLANRPSTAPIGRKFYATDVRALFRYDPDNPLSDGDGWVTIGGMGVANQPLPGTAYFSGLSVNDLTVEGSASGIAHADLDGIGSDDHHTKTTSGDIDHDATQGGTRTDAHHAKTTSGEIDHDATNGGTRSDAHHPRYDDPEARAAVEGSVDAADLTGASGTAGQILKTDGAAASWDDPTDAFDGVASNLSVTEWEVIDVGNEGFPGDRSGGDLAQFIADTVTAGGHYVFYLPRGTYEWNRPLLLNGGTGTYEEPEPESFAIVGKPEATIRGDIPTSSQSLFFRFGSSNDGFGEVTLKNLHFDIGDHVDSRDAGIMRAYVANRGHFENITLTGRKKNADDGTSNGNRHTFKLDVVEPDGMAFVKDVRFPDGDIYISSAGSVGHAIPFAAEPSHVGTTYWVNCYCEGFIDNGFYLRDGPGSNYLFGCHAKDNAAGQFRLGRNDYAQNIRAEVTPACQFNSTPLWLSEIRDSVPDPDADNQDQYVEGDEDAAPIVVEGFEILAEGDMVNDVIRITSNPGQVTLKGGYIRCQADDYIIDDSSYTGSTSIRDVTIDDHATGNTRIGALRLAGDNILLDDVTYRAFPPDTENGRSIFYMDAQNIRVRDSRLVGTYTPMVEAEAGADFEFDDCRLEHDGSYTDPYLVRAQSSPIERIELRNNRAGAYTGGLNVALSDVNTYYASNNDGLDDSDVVAKGTATLSSGAAVVDTGESSPKIDVYLDPSGGGANAADVKVAARAFFDSAAGTVKVEILEDGTSVGNPDVGYEIVRA